MRASWFIIDSAIIDDNSFCMGDFVIFEIRALHKLTTWLVAIIPAKAGNHKKD
jgi:hypothetical protein